MSEQTFGEWVDVSIAKPGMLVPVLVAGVLEYEQTADVHEGFWTGKAFSSVRECKFGKMQIAATHWMPMPPLPEAKP